MNWIAESIVAALLLIGAFFLLVGSFGLAKLPDLMRRLHGPTKATTLGIGSTLIASMVFVYATLGQLSIHELLITIFLFLTAPVTAHMIAKAAILLDQQGRLKLPATGAGAGWATLDSPPREGDTPDGQPGRQTPA